MSRPPSHALKRSKRTLRRAVLARRDALPAGARAAKARTIVERVLALPEIRRASTVMAFWSFGSEVDTSGLVLGLHAAGIRIALPRIRDAEVVPVAYEPGDEVRETSFGAMEPTSAAEVDPGAIDVIVAPGVAFDRRGNRVGYGRGYYDRLLARVRSDAAIVAMAFELQVMDEVPAGGDDRSVDAIVTEREVIRCRRR